ncbi:hypothetical protein Tco_1303619 [Tanacetum coccineum]
MLVENDYESWKIRIHSYERFVQIEIESIHDYFVALPQAWNDMKITQLENPYHQCEHLNLSQAFQPMGKYVTNVSRNMDISNHTLCSDLHSNHLKAYGLIAKKDSQENNRSSLKYCMIPLAMFVTPHLHLLFITSTPQSSNLLIFHHPTIQLRTSSNSRTHATVHDGHIVTEPIQRKAPGNCCFTDWKLQRKDDVWMLTLKHSSLMWNATALMINSGLTTTNMFKPIIEDAYDQTFQMQRDARDEHLDSDAETRLYDNRSVSSVSL